jgi:hypothetical protein
VPLVIAAGWASDAAQAQQSYRVRRDESFRKDPASDAVLLASVPQGSVVPGGATRDGWVEVTLDGWIWAASIQPTDREGHNRVVNARGGENLRAEPNGRVVARLATGCLLTEFESRAGWARVRRTGWMRSRSLEPAGVAASAGSETASASAGEGAGLDRAITATQASLRRVPDGSEIGTLLPDAPLRVLARSGEWVRVQTEGWVREEDLKPAAPGVLMGVSGAEVRSRPREFEGQLVQWTLQHIAIQRADELRTGIPPGRRYLLARGPLPEAGFVYVILTDEQVGRLERVPALTHIVIVGRVRVGRSEYLGNPILELVELALREP